VAEVHWWRRTLRVIEMKKVLLREDSSDEILVMSHNACCVCARVRTPATALTRLTQLRVVLMCRGMRTLSLSLSF
jgi:hypothetical protein